jgi:MFS transporter, DHA3 family, macrolide efflux protein
MSQSATSTSLNPTHPIHATRALREERASIRNFLLIWAGQFVSRIGTAMTRFALVIWAYEQTGAATALALLGFFAFLPAILVNPVAGVWVDRLDRHTLMILADVGAGLMTLTLLVVHLGSGLLLWHLYLTALVAGAFEAFQGPAYSAATTLLIPKSHYGRAAGLRYVAENGSYVIAPFLAGVLLLSIQLPGVMLVDLFTVGIALVTLLVARVPAAPITPHAASQHASFWQEMQVGTRYVWRFPGLLGLTLIFMGLNFIAALTYYSTLPALILARSGGDTLALAGVQGALGAAGVVGGAADQRVGRAAAQDPRHLGRLCTLLCLRRSSDGRRTHAAPVGCLRFKGASLPPRTC